MSVFNFAIGVASTIRQDNIVGSPGQLEQLVRAAVSGAVQPYAAQIAELATETSLGCIKSGRDKIQNYLRSLIWDLRAGIAEYLVGPREETKHNIEGSKFSFTL
jgi:hypothetical protein